MKYRQSKDFILKNISGDDVLISRGKMALKVNGVFVFNEACSFLWSSLSEPKTVEELADSFQTKYKIDEDTALHDIKVCLREMLENEMVESIEESSSE